MSSESERPPKIWITILVGIGGTLLGAAVGPVVTAALNAKPNLIYQVFPANVTTVAGQSSAVYAFHAVNQGGRMAEQVLMVIGVPGATLSRVSVSQPAGTNVTEQVSGSDLTVMVPSLNPSESLDVRFEATSTSLLPSRADVNLRAQDTNGKESPIRRPLSARDFLDVPVMAVIYIAFSLWFSKRGKALNAKLDKTNEAIDQNRTDFNALKAEVEAVVAQDLMHPKLVLAYACRINGLPAVADEYLARTGDVAYWAEVDRLTDRVISQESRDQALTEYGRLVDVCFAITRAAEVQPATRAIFALDMLRVAIKWKFHDKDSHKKRLKDSYELDSNITEVRVELDPIFAELKDDLQLLKLGREKSETAGTGPGIA